jgi:polysaccharide export outer membrane protein
MKIIIQYFLKAFLLLSFLTINLSCSGTKDILYVQNVKETSLSNEDLINQKLSFNDILSIKIFSTDFDTSKFYNYLFDEKMLSSQNLEIFKINSYLVDSSGNILIPILGQIYVLDKTVEDLEKYITEKLKNDNHLINPIVDVKLINSKFTVLGEVKLPGTYTFHENSLSLFQALGMAGDLTIYGKRDNVTLIREIKGIKHVSKIDLTASDLLDSPVYNIKPNDIIIVSPNKAKIKSAGVIGNPGTIISAVSLLLTGIILFTR